MEKNKENFFFLQKKNLKVNIIFELNTKNEKYGKK